MAAKLEVSKLGECLLEHGFDFYSGVPCSHLTPLINFASNNCRYVAAANEGDAVAACAGAHLGGRRTVALFQNSGLTNALSPLTSLNNTFRIPVLGFVSLRGEPGGGDEPQHDLMGRITGTLLDTLAIRWCTLSNDENEMLTQVDAAAQSIADDESFVFVVRRETFANEPLNTRPRRHHTPAEIQGSPGVEGAMPTRQDILAHLAGIRSSDTVMLASTGYTGRQLAVAHDAPGNFYMVGSMGCVSSIGLGLALARPEVPVVAIDGDGALLMRLGALPTNGNYRPPNLLHILLDNGRHESTGGQVTVSSTTDFAAVAAACGYARVRRCADVDALAQWVAEWSADPLLTFVHVATAPGVPDDLGRPALGPVAVKERLMRWLDDRHA